MKKKSVFLILSIFVLGIASALSFFQISTFENSVYAESATASVWDGNFSTDDNDGIYVDGGGKNYHIVSAKGLAYVSAKVKSGMLFTDDTIYLECDIDLNKKLWTPIGDETYAFKGNFDGQGHTIYNLMIDDALSTNYSKVGLFGVAYGTISNVILSDVDIDVSGRSAVGGLVANMTANSMKDISVSGKINATGATYIGGVVGYTSVLDGIRNFSNITSSVAITGDATYVGGAFGKFYFGRGALTETSFTGTIEVSAEKVGGILGQIDSFGKLKNIYNSGTITNNSSTVSYNGCLVGSVLAFSFDRTISNFYNSGDIICGEGDSYANNFYASVLFSSIEKSGNNTLTIANCFNLGKLIVSSTEYEVAFYNNSSNTKINVKTPSNSHVEWNTVIDSSTLNNLATFAKTKSFYSNEIYFNLETNSNNNYDYAWDFDSVWKITNGINGNLPYLVNNFSIGTANKGSANNDTNYSYGERVLEGNGTAESPYVIRTAADLGYVSTQYNGVSDSSWSGKYYVLANDIDLTGKTWQPIGYSESTPFSGVFDGNGHTISGITCSLQYQFSYHGLFGVTSNAVIKNLTVSSINFINGGTASDGSSGYKGSFVGYVASDTYLINCVDNTSENSVGRVSESSLKVVYGKNNISESGLSNTLNLNVSETFYDVEIDGNGGVIYKSANEIVTGEYHVIVDGDGAIISNEIDSTYLTQLLGLSENISSSPALIKRGAKLSGYKLIASGSEIELDSVDFSKINFTVGANLLGGVQAVFDYGDGILTKSFQVIYNQYEIDNFGADDSKSIAKSAVYTVLYDSVLENDYPDILKKESLRGDNFEIEDFYLGLKKDTFETNVDAKAFVNDKFVENGTIVEESSKTYGIYTHWIGKQSAQFTFSIKFSKVDDSIYGKIDNLADAISSVKLDMTSEISGVSPQQKTATLSVGSDGTVTATFVYDTRFSTSINDGIKLTITLNAGYEFATLQGNENAICVTDFDFDDYSFGHLTVGFDPYSDSSEHYYSNQNIFTFRNLVGNYTLNAIIQRKTFSTALNISEDEVYLAIAPNISGVTQVGIYNSDQSTDQSNISTKNEISGDQYVGYDAKNNVVLTSQSEESDNFTSTATNGSTLMRYTFSEGSYRYFLTEKTTAGTSTEYSFYEVDSTLKKIDLLAILITDANGNYSSVKYLTNGQFSILAEVKDIKSGSTTISSYQAFNDDTKSIYPNTENTIIHKKEDSDVALRYTFDIETIEKDNSDQILLNPTNTLNIVTKFTKVTFSFYFEDESGNEIKNNAPSVTIDSLTFATAEYNGTVDVEFDLTSSNYYKFKEISGGVSFWGNGWEDSINYNIRMEAASVTDDTNDYTSNFNARNTTFSVISYKYNKGTRSNGNFALDTYTFTLQYGADLRAGRYKVFIVCEKVYYTINFSTQSIKSSEKTNFTTESGDGVPTVSVNASGEEISSGYASLSYNFEIEAETDLGTNNAFVFYGWYAIGENWQGYIKSIGSEYDSTDIAFTYSDIYDYVYNIKSNLASEHDNRNYELTLYAVYIRKEINISLYKINSNTQVELDGERYLESQLGLSFGLSYNGTSTINYTYSSSDENLSSAERAEKFSFSFTKTGSNKSAYYVSGFRLLSKNGEDFFVITADGSGDYGSYANYSETNSEVLVSFDLSQFFFDQLTGGDYGESVNFTVMPIVTRKSADLHIVSGTGDGINGTCTDGRAGVVFDSDGNITTSDVLNMSDIVLGTNVYFSQANSVTFGGETTQMVVNNHFASRTGYSLAANNFWAWTSDGKSGSLNGSTFYLSTKYFETTAETDTKIDIYLYRVWTANTYELIFNRNGGTFDNTSNSTVSVSVTYDAPVSWSKDAIKVTRNGYNLVGWTYNEVDVFDETGAAASIAGVIDEDLNWIAPNSITVFAHWGPKQYVVRVISNGANTIGGVSVGESVDITMTYGDSFADVFSTYGFDGGAKVPTRLAFNFSGLYANGSYKQTITSGTIFSSDITSFQFKEGNEPSLTLYLQWSYDTSFYSLSLVDNTITKTYTSQDLSFYLAEYFKNGFNASGYVVDIINDQTIQISTPALSHTSVEFALTSQSATIDSSNLLFTLKNAGSNTVNLILTITDLIEADKTLSTTSLTLNAEVEKATLNVSIESDNESVWLINAKRIMENYVSSAVATRIKNCRDFGSFVTILKSIDSTISASATNADVYEFVMFKYSQMLTSTNYSYYKEMTYEDFANLKAQDSTAIESVVSNLYLFEFIDNSEPTTISTSYNSVVLAASQTVNSVLGEVEIYRLAANTTAVAVGSLYYLRAYIKAKSGASLDNYDLSYDSNNEAYVELGQIYFLPEVMVIENQSATTASYYNVELNEVSIDWQGEREAIEYSGNTYYNVGDGLYVHAKLITSNTGKEKEDTTYCFTDQDNYLYYTDTAAIRRVLGDDGEYVVTNVSNSYAFIVEEADAYSILNVDGVAQVYVETKYVSFIDGFMEFASLPSAVSSDLLRFTEVTYDLSDGKGTQTLDYDGDYLQEGAYQVDGVLICQIETTAKNSISAIFSKFVQSVTVVTSEKSVSDYISLYKWMEQATYSVDGTMESNTSHTISKADMGLGDGSLSTYNLYAVYTDMVMVSYNLNFPQTFTSTSPTTTWLKLGSSTVDDLSIPRENGFVLASLTATKPDKTTVSYEKIFDSRDGKFRGISSTSMFTKVVLEAKWNIEDITYEQNLTSLKKSVGGFEYLDAMNVLYVTNKNTGLFTYTYEWSKDGTVLSKTDQLTLADNGRAQDSGTYTLKVTATVKKEFVTTALESTDGSTNSVSVDFDLEFLKSKLREINFFGSSTFEYDSEDHIDGWFVEIKYSLYDSTIDDYSEDVVTESEAITSPTKLVFSLLYNGSETDSIINAGTYSVSIYGKEAIFSNVDEFGTKEFEIVVNPCVVELDDKNLDFSKYFNAEDPSLTREIFLANEIVEFVCERETGEDLGEYKVFLKSITEGKENNYLFTIGGVTVYQNGVTDDGKTTAVGTFSINGSGTLRLAYTVTEDAPQVIETDFNTEGFSVSLDGFTLNIYKGAALFKSLELSLYDGSLEQTITNETILGIIGEHFGDVEIKFYNSGLYDSVRNSGTYTYAFSNTTDIARYYSSILFETGYEFVIDKIVIDVDKLNFNKTYDGLTAASYSVSGQKIDNINTFEGVYLSITYSSAHAGEVKASIGLMEAGDKGEISNYHISASSVQAEIEKLTATMTISMTRTSFKYGEISTSNINQHVSNSFAVATADGSDVTSLLQSGYYKITYSTPSVSTNANGYLYAGNYSLVATGEFSDFEMNFVLPSFVIEKLEIQKSITKGQYTILSTQTVEESYSESYRLGTTGDEFTIVYTVPDLAAGRAGEVGYYNLALKSSTFVNDSVEVKIDEKNNGFAIKKQEDLVYLTIDSSILTQTYNGEEYSIVVDKDALTLTITNGTDKNVSALKFTKAADGSVVDDIVFEDLKIFSDSNTTTFVNADSYRLQFSASSSYQNIVFKEDYVLTISRRSIDASKLTLTKTYDASSSLEIDEFDEKVTSDDVTIVAKFDKVSVDTDISVSLVLRGTESGNYVLTNTSGLKGTITKANATVSLTQTEFVYGGIMARENPAFTVVCDGYTVSSSQYTISFEVQNPTYSQGFLIVGQYDIIMASSSTSSNYNLTFAGNQKITVSALSISVTLSTSGQYSTQYGSTDAKSTTFVGSYETPLNESVEFTFTRETGEDVGYYKVTAAVSKSNNYTVSNTTDSSAGAFRITKTDETIWLLLSDAEVVSGTDEMDLVVEYDKNLYDKVSIATKGGTGRYQLKIESSTRAAATKSFDINYYSYNSETNEYTRLDNINVDALKATLAFANEGGAQDVGRYAITVTNISSENYGVNLGQYGKTLILSITRKQLYFKTRSITKVFDNKEAVLSYDDPTEILDGILDDDVSKLDLEIRLTKSGNVEKYVGYNLSVEATLKTDEDNRLILSNYDINLLTKDGESISGSITPAKIEVTINDQTFIYGQEISIDFDYSSDVDLTGYEKGISVTVSPYADKDDYSTSGALKVGEYGVVCLLSGQDFMATYIINGAKAENANGLTITVLQKQLSLQGVSEDLQDIFTKTYDGSNAVELQSADGSDRISLVGVVKATKQDDVKLTAATYASEYLGQSIKITFTLEGEDISNYTISDWEYGVIEAVEISLNFEYNATGSNVKSDVETNGRVQISSLAYPFMSDTNLTSNSANSLSSNDKNFPTDLTGRTGYRFTGWTMSFGGLVEDDDAYKYLIAILTNLKMTYTYAESTVAVTVGNNSQTLSLLKTILANENDYLGYYYKTHDDISVTFDANWEVMKYKLNVMVADQTGDAAEYGEVTIIVGDATEAGVITGETEFSQSFEYGTKIKLLASANAHCTYYGFFSYTGKDYGANPPSGISIVSTSGGAELTINSLSTTYSIAARFEADTVNVELDLSESSDITMTATQFSKQANGKYLWQATYLDLQSFKLSQLGLKRDGYLLTQMKVDTETTNYDKDVTIASLVSDGKDSISLTPIFEAVGVVVTLNFNDGKTANVNLTVPFGQAYSAAEGWIETPEFLGHEFNGWLNAQNSVVTGETVLSTTENHTLTAAWTLSSYSVKLLAKNVEISSEDLTFEKDGDVYDLGSLDYGTIVSFTVTPNVGYILSDYDNWADIFSVSISNGVASVRFAVPAEDVEYEILGAARDNSVQLSGEHIGEILAYDITEGKTELEVEDGAVSIQTGRTLRFVVSAEYGYQMSDVVSCSDSNAIITHEISNGNLVIEISSIVRDLTIDLSTLEAIKNVSIKFEDSTKIEDFVVNGQTYSNYDSLSPFQVVVGESLEIYVKYVHGTEFDDFEQDGDYDILCLQASGEGYYAQNGYYKMTVSSIESDGEITLKSKVSQFTLSVKVISYNDSGVSVFEEENKILVGGEQVSEVKQLYGSQVELTYEKSSIYSFAGWSIDGEKEISLESKLTYTISDDETIYAIFSSYKYTITLKTYNTYTIGSEYNDSLREQTIYQDITRLGKFADSNTGSTISSLELYFGSSKTLVFTVPEGYSYYGIGYYISGSFQMLETNHTNAEKVEISISSADFTSLTSRAIDLYAVVMANSFSIKLNSEIDINGQREENDGVGGMTLQSESGASTNRYGYVNGTRVHYSVYDWNNGMLSNDRQFTVIGYTGDDVYIKIETTRAGYKFYNVESDTSGITLLKVSAKDNVVVYKIGGIVGSTSGKEVNITVLFRPNLNNIKIGFVCQDAQVDGGSITYAVDEENNNKVFASGKDYSSTTISAYTDSMFEVYAYVKAGFYITESDIQILCDNNIIDQSTIELKSLALTTSGYTARLRFVVRDFDSANEIKIVLKSITYTVKLVEDNTSLATIKNVEFGSTINLYQSNKDNIEIYDTSRISFIGGKLTFAMKKEGYNFEGFFTNENGAGVLYIDASGTATQNWNESGYTLNSLTSNYELSQAAFFNEETGEMEITLFGYWSYFKTRIKFELVPSVTTTVTAQDIVSGVDYSNSWFYQTSKYYIEIAFNTNIYINAPTILGYEFYKFVIDQKDINGNWLEQVVTFSSEVPWSTNESDNIVEVNVQIVYFALIEVTVRGGDGSFTISQDCDDAQAKALVENNYVDTTKNFTLHAVFDEANYEFYNWNDYTNGKYWQGKDWEGLQVSQRTRIVMNLQGKSFSISFKDANDKIYDYTFGQILSVWTVSTDGTTSLFSLGSYNLGKFEPGLEEVPVKVGDKVTFSVAIDSGFSVIWNQSDITLNSYSNGRYSFEMTISSCPEDGILRILPQFKNEVMTIYINRDFVEKDIISDAVDLNSVSVAGYATFDGKKTDFVSSSYEVDAIKITLVTNDRYKISSVVIKNYEQTYNNMEDFISNGNIVLTKEYLTKNDIVGILQIEIKYTRAMWEEQELSINVFEGGGTDSDPFKINTVEDLVLMMQLCNSGAQMQSGKLYRSASYILMNDLQLSEEFWTPIGTNEYAFNGYFNFNNHKVTGIYTALFYDVVSYGGLFGVLTQNALIIESLESLWYVFLIAGVAVVVIVSVIISVVVSKKKKKRRHTLANK